MNIKFESSPIRDRRVKLLVNYTAAGGHQFSVGDKVMPAERCDQTGIIGLINPRTGGIVQFTRREWM